MSAQAQIRRATGAIEAIGSFPLGSPDPGIDIVTLTDEQVARLGEPGTKVLSADGTITVTPPPPPPPLPPLPDYGSDATTDYQALVDAVTSLRAYLAVASPTNTQTIAAFKLLIRVVLFMLKRTIG